MPQKPPGIPITQAARVSTFAQSISRNQSQILDVDLTHFWRRFRGSGQGRSPDWLKMKNPACEAVKRETEEDWG